MKHGKTKILLLIGLVLAIGIFAAVTRATAAPLPAQPAQAVPTPEIPFFDLWSKSGHNDAKAEAFVHWDEDSPKEIPVGCAKCHGAAGFQDFVGADGSAAGKVDKAAATGSTVTCTTCHNAATVGYSEVTFPSGAVVSGLGREAVCMTCHQGAASGASVDAKIKDAAVANDDTVSDKITFTNIHYFAAAVSRYGKVVAGGYQYPGKSYDAMFDHALGVQTCQDCHNPHSLELEVEKCATCHTGATSVAAVQKIRYAASTVDYDGDGNVTEGIRDEITGLQTMLFTAMQSYAKNVVKTELTYSSTAYPYFFVDTNKDGKPGTDEAVFPNAYKSWTGRLAKAAFNYQTSLKDPGAYAHGGKYIIQLLYDSIEDLNTKLTAKVDLAKANRLDQGHFAGSEEAFRHWDEEGGIVPTSCVRCHTGEGLPQFIANGSTIAMPASNGLLCETCHSDLTTMALYPVKAVPFPSGASLSFGETATANLCLECHQGRESTVSVNRVIAGKDVDTVDEKLGFRNVHYFAAGATFFGTEAKGMYEYKDQTYKGKFTHPAPADSCVGCHDPHKLQVKVESCAGCHQGKPLEEIRMATSTDDFDGDGNKTEGIKAELDTMSEQLYTAILAYAKGKNAPIVYSPSAYPYWFGDANSNGKVDEGEKGYAAWTPRLLQAAYNYQYTQKDPGAFVHNGKYVMQAVYDSIKDLKGDVTKLVRPK